MQFYEAAVRIFLDAEGPLRIEQIWSQIERRKLVHSFGRWPEKTLRTQIRERCIGVDRPKRGGKEQIFRQSGRGLYELVYPVASAVLIPGGATISSGKTQSGIGSDRTLPEEVPTPERFVEGATRIIAVNAYERNADARAACIAHYGAVCQACGMDFGRVYPGIGEGYIQVHHVKPLSQTGGEYVVNPIEDLSPVCANCHAMIHRRERPYSIDEIRAVVSRSNNP